MNRMVVAAFFAVVSSVETVFSEEDPDDAVKFLLAITVAVRQSCYDYRTTPAFDKYFIRNFKKVADRAVATNEGRDEMRGRVSDISRQIASLGCKKFVEKSNEITTRDEPGVPMFAKD